MNLAFGEPIGQVLLEQCEILVAKLASLLGRGRVLEGIRRGLLFPDLLVASIALRINGSWLAICLLFVHGPTPINRDNLRDYSFMISVSSVAKNKNRGPRRSLGIIFEITPL
jgi:hypothetical protein